MSTVCTCIKIILKGKPQMGFFSKHRIQFHAFSQALKLSIKVQNNGMEKYIIMYILYLIYCIGK